VSVVLDSSVTLAWIYSDETNQAIREVFEQVADAGAAVPALWRLEVANSLTVAVRRRRIDAEFRRAALSDLACWTSPQTSIPMRTPGARRCISPIATALRFMMRAIWSLHTDSLCRSPHWTKTSAPQRPSWV
jgi:hypothetical protein